MKCTCEHAPCNHSHLYACEWESEWRFTVKDEPGEHDPCYLILPGHRGGPMVAFNHDAKNGVDQARAKFIADACNRELDRLAYAQQHRAGVDDDQVQRVFNLRREIREAEALEKGAMEACDDHEKEWQQARVLVLHAALTAALAGANP